jgi:hypothetical protein
MEEPVLNFVVQEMPVDLAGMRVLTAVVTIMAMKIVTAIQAIHQLGMIGWLRHEVSDFCAIPKVTKLLFN